MNYRLFGTTGLKVSEVGCGCSHLGGTAERRDDREVLATLGEALASGITFFDTADIYGQGRAEELVGRAVKGRRNSVVLAGKAGYRLSAVGGWMARMKPLARPLVSRINAAMPATGRATGLSAVRVRESQIRQDFSPAYLRRAIEKSLRRLGTDRLDLFQLHDPPVAAAETDGLLEMLASLKREGKVRSYGVSCRTACDAGYWLQYPGIASLQIRINLASFEEVLTILHEAARKGIAIIARQPFASGKFEKLDLYRFLARDGRTLAQAALQFALQFPEISVVIAGMRTREHLRENLQALHAPPLREEELEQIYHAGKAYVN